ncbi:MAG: D-glycero-D-manno-heptose 1,7-bisphosphate phosphatase, partial [Pseudohongiellaceae bacterium]
MTARPAAFIDRDGTLIEERNYPITEADIVPLPRAGNALRRLSAAGYLCIILTNQSAVARGMIDEERLAQLHEHL